MTRRLIDFVLDEIASAIVSLIIEEAARWLPPLLWEFIARLLGG